MSIVNLKERKYSIMSIIALNLIVIIGIIFFNWDGKFLILSFWIETLIIWLYTRVKLIWLSWYRLNKKSIFQVVVFPIHFWFFLLWHFRFINELIFRNWENIDFSYRGLFLVIASIIISHGVSFYTNFIKNEEYITSNKFQEISVVPYIRIIPMHIAIFVMMFADARSAILFIVIFKMIADILVHENEHRRLIGKSKV